MALQLDYQSPQVRRSWSVVRVMSWMLAVTAFLSWPSVYIYVDEQMRLASNPWAYRFELFERQPGWLFLLWLAGFLGRPLLALASFVFWVLTPTRTTGWRAIATIALAGGVVLFEIAVDFYHYMSG